MHQDNGDEPTGAKGGGNRGLKLRVSVVTPADSIARRHPPSDRALKFESNGDRDVIPVGSRRYLDSEREPPRRQPEWDLGHG